MEPESSASQNIKHATERGSVNIGVNAYPPSSAEINFDQANLLLRRSRGMPRILRRWRLHDNSRGGWPGNMDRNQMRRCSFVMLICSCLTTPSKDQAPRDPILASNLRYFRARRKCLLGNPRFLTVRPTPPALEAVQNLNPHRLRDLKYVLKVASFANLHEQTRRSSPEADAAAEAQAEAARIKAAAEAQAEAARDEAMAEAQAKAARAKEAAEVAETELASPDEDFPPAPSDP